MAPTAEESKSPKRTAKRGVRTVSPPSQRQRRPSRSSRARFTKLLTGDIAIVEGVDLALHNEESEGFQKWTKVTRQAAVHFEQEWKEKTFSYIMKKLGPHRRFLRGRRDDSSTGELKWEIMGEDSIHQSVQNRFYRCCEALAVESQEAKPSTPPSIDKDMEEDGVNNTESMEMQETNNHKGADFDDIAKGLGASIAKDMDMKDSNSMEKEGANKVESVEMKEANNQKQEDIAEIPKDMDTIGVKGMVAKKTNSGTTAQLNSTSLTSNNENNGGEEALQQVLWNADVGNSSTKETTFWNRVRGFWGWPLKSDG